jgi:hypothetical protein
MKEFWTPLSRSTLEDAARCKRKFYYKHVLGLKEQTSSQGASEGTIIHAGLAAVFKFIQARQDSDLVLLQDWDETNTILKGVALRAMADMIAAGTYEYRGEKFNLAPGCQEQETIERLGDVVQYYIDNQLKNDMANARVVGVEENYVISVDGVVPFVLEGQLDLVLLRLYEGAGAVYEVVDHKTVASNIEKSVSFLRLDVQFLVYEWLATELLPSCSVEMIYNLIRRERPPGYGTRELRRNKDGRPAANNASQDPKDYLRQVRVAHTGDELDHVKKELANLAYNAMDLMSMKDPGAFTRTVIMDGSNACENCTYFTKCAAELVGHGQPNWGLEK